MNSALYYFSLGSFLLLPGLLLSIRYFHPCRMPWWAVAALLTVAGWVLVNGTVYFGFKHLGEMIESHPNPPEEWMEQYVSDGAPRVFAAILGWLYGPIYSIPFFLFFGVVSKLSVRKDEASA